MENPSKGSPKQPAVERCWKTYNYAVRSESGFKCAGTFFQLRAISPERATLLVGQVAAKLAFDCGFPFDPFNAEIMVKPKRPKRKCKK